MYQQITHLDTGIYCVACFRMPLYTKFGHDNNLQIVSDHTFLDALVTYIPDYSKLLHFKEDIKPKVFVPIQKHHRQR